MAKEKENKVRNDNKNFMKDVKAELKKVVWPTSKQMVSNVTAVLTIVLVTAAIVFCLDFVFGAMNKYGIDKIREKAQANNQSNTQVVDTTTDGGETNNSEEGTNDSEETVNVEENTESEENAENGESANNTENTQNN